MPIVPSYNLDATLSQVIDLVVSQAIEAVPEHARLDARGPPDQAPSDRAVIHRSNQTNTRGA